MYSALLCAFLGFVYRMAPPHWLSLLFFVPVIWGIERTRKGAWLAVLAYYAAATCDLPFGAAVFFGEDFPFYRGIALWTALALILSLPWALFWPEEKTFMGVLWRAGAALFVSSVPPIGIVGGASPLLAAGWLYQGTGFTGIAALLCSEAFMVSAACGGPSPWGPAAFLATLFALCAFIPAPGSSYADRWTPLNTSYGRPVAGSNVRLVVSARATDLFPRIAKCGGDYILLPESLAGAWTDLTKMRWEAVGRELRSRGGTVVFGAEEYGRNLKYDNTIRFLGSDGGHVYRQRVPVPISMWNPWAGSGANAHWSGSGVVRMQDGKRIACLMCYESFLVFPVMASFLADPGISLILCISNHWWSRGTFLPYIGYKSVMSWSRLFGVPLVSAVNL